MVQFRLRALEQTTSTNDEVKRALDAGEPEGLAVRALRQTAAYGRQGRSWQSPEGGLYESFLLRPSVPPAQLPTLSLAVGVAVRRALVSLVPREACAILLKWPNDVVVGSRAADSAMPVRAAFRKLCGISTEAHGGGICVGVGVNITRPGAQAAGAGAGSGARDIARAASDTGVCAGARGGAGTAPGEHGGADASKEAVTSSAPAPQNVPIYLSDLGYCEGTARERIEAASDALRRELARVYDAWCAEGFAPLRPAFDDCAALTGRHVGIVNYYSGDVTVRGTVLGVDDFGRLLLRDAAGSTHLVSSGEAHIV